MLELIIQGAIPPKPFRLKLQRANHLTMSDLLDLFQRVPTVNAEVLSCLHPRSAARLPRGRAQRRDVLRLRTTSASLRAYSMDDVLWFAYFEHCCGCACGRCEARWLINGWICPLLYWYL